MLAGHIIIAFSANLTSALVLSESRLLIPRKWLFFLCLSFIVLRVDLQVSRRLLVEVLCVLSLIICSLTSRDHLRLASSNRLFKKSCNLHLFKTSMQYLGFVTFSENRFQYLSVTSIFFLCLHFLLASSVSRAI